jgi:hypothetical protein
MWLCAVSIWRGSCALVEICGKLCTVTFYRSRWTFQPIQNYEFDASSWHTWINLPEHFVLCFRTLNAEDILVQISLFIYFCLMTSSSLVKKTQLVHTIYGSVSAYRIQTLWADRGLWERVNFIFKIPIKWNHSHKCIKRKKKQIKEKKIKKELKTCLILTNT